MKKSLLMLSLLAFGLAGCNSGSSDTTAAEITSAGTPDWQNPEIQQAPMPSTMTQPSYQAPQAVQNIPQPLGQGAQPSYGMPQTAQGGMKQNETVGNCQVIRDGANSPIYAQIQKGCYTDASYTVGKQDTVFLIAYLSGTSVSDIARLNHLVPPYQLKMGQVLRLK